MRSLGLWKLLMLVALAVGPTTVAAQEPQPATPATRQGVIEQAQAEKARPAPVRPGQGRTRDEQSRRHPGQRADLASVLRERLPGRRLSVRRRLQAAREPVQRARRARQLHVQRLQARGGRVPRAAPVPPPRRAVAPRGLARGDTGRLLRHRAGLIEGRSAPATSSSSRTSRPLSRSGRPVVIGRWAAGWNGREWQQRPGHGSFPSVETVFTPRDAAWPGRRRHLHPLAGDGGFRLASVPRLCAARRLLRGDGARLHRHQRRLRLQSDRLRGDPAHPDPARSLGPDAPRPARRPPTTKAASRSRSSCCPRWAAAPRCAASAPGASAIATACCCRPSGASWRTASSIPRCSTTPARSRRAPRTSISTGCRTTVGVGFRFHSPDATVLRIDVARSQEGTRVVFAPATCSERVSHVSRSSVRACRVAPARLVLVAAALVLWGSPVSTQTPRFYPDDPIAREPESQDASRAKPYEIESLYEMTHNLFVTAGYKPSGTRARNINTIDEVPDSGWFTNRIGPTGQPDHGRCDRARPDRRRAAGPVALGVDRREDGRRASGIHGAGRAGRDVVHRVRSRRQSGGRDRRGDDRDEVLLGVRLQPGRKFPDDVRSEARDDRPEGHGAASVRREDAVHVGRSPRDPRRRRPQRRRDLSHRRRTPDSRQDPRQLPALPARVPTIPTTSCRTSTAASCARCASSARGRISRISRRATRSTRSSAENGRTTVKHYLQDVGSTFGMCNDVHEWDLSYEYFYEGDTTRRRFFSLGFALSPWQRIRYVEYPSIGKFEGDRFDPAHGVRRRRRRPTWRCVTTMRSGRRGGSRRSATS